MTKITRRAICASSIALPFATMAKEQPAERLYTEAEVIEMICNAEHRIARNLNILDNHVFSIKKTLPTSLPEGFRQNADFYAVGGEVSAVAFPHEWQRGELYLRFNHKSQTWEWIL